MDLLNNGEVACHPFILGELACGNLKNRTTVLSLLEALPMALLAEHPLFPANTPPQSVFALATSLESILHYPSKGPGAVWNFRQPCIVHHFSWVFGSLDTLLPLPARFVRARLKNSPENVERSGGQVVLRVSLHHDVRSRLDITGIGLTAGVFTQPDTQFLGHAPNESLVSNHQ